MRMMEPVKPIRSADHVILSASMQCGKEPLRRKDNDTQPLLGLHVKVISIIPQREFDLDIVRVKRVHRSPNYCTAATIYQSLHIGDYLLSSLRQRNSLFL